MISIEQKKAIEANGERTIVVAGPGSGKALVGNAQVYTPYGKKKIKNIKPGEHIMCEDGKFHTVLGHYPQKKKQIVEVSFSDGAVTKCCKEHLWTYSICGVEKTGTTQEMYSDWDSLIDKNNLTLPQSKPSEFLNNISLVGVPSYYLGFLVGSGLLFANPQKIDRILAKASLNPNSKKILKLLKVKEKNLQYALLNVELINKSYAFLNKENAYQSLVYLPLKERRSFLQGFLDFAQVNPGGDIPLLSFSENAISGIKEIIESLGGMCVASKPVGVSRLVYLYVSPIPEMKDTKDFIYSSLRTIDHFFFSKTKADMYCIKVDNPTSLFLTDNFVVTHNTRVVTERIKHLLDGGTLPENLYAVTFTNFAAQEMKERLGERGCFIGTIHSLANKLLKEMGVPTYDMLEKEQFDELLTKYIDMSMGRPPKRIEHVLVDEFQDLSDLEFDFLKSLEIEHLFVVGDSDQSIYSFKGSNVGIFRSCLRNKRYDKIVLRDNYRTPEKILKFAQEVLRTSEDRDYCIKSEDPGIVSTGIPLKEALSFIEASDTLYKDWFILTRTNNELSMIQQELAKMKIPTATFKKGDVGLAGAKTILEENAVKVLTIHSAKGLEADNVIVVGVRSFNKEERRVGYVAATRAKKRLIWCNETPKKGKYKNKPKIVKFGVDASWNDFDFIKDAPVTGLGSPDRDIENFASFGTSFNTCVYDRNRSSEEKTIDFNINMFLDEAEKDTLFDF